MQYKPLKINYENKNHFGYGNTAKFKNADVLSQKSMEMNILRLVKIQTGTDFETVAN